MLGDNHSDPNDAQDADVVQEADLVMSGLDRLADATSSLVVAAAHSLDPGATMEAAARVEAILGELFPSWHDHPDPDDRPTTGSL